tara:strand:- start:275 stop:1732 length:1458 start_codon:yes stop_codon:yes gene_type:complete
MVASDIAGDVQRSVAPIEVSAQLIASLYKRANALVYANFGALILLTISLWGKADTQWLLAWAIVLSCWTALRFVLAKVYLRKPRAIADTWKWTVAFSVGSGIAGCLWGSSVFLIEALDPGNQNLTIAFVMAALSAAAIAGYSNSLMAFAAFTTPSLSVFGVELIWRDGTPDTMIALFVIFWGSLLWVMAKHLNHGFRDGLELSLQKAKLAGRLAVERDRAQAANQAKSRFLGHMSHELRTPLNAIIGYSGMMSQNVFGPLGHENYNGYATDIETSGQHLLGMVERVLQISDIESGAVDLREEPVVLATATEAALAPYLTELSARGIETATDIPDTMPPVHGDPEKISLMLDCLLSNAVRYTPNGGHIRVAGAVVDDEAHLTVSDSGPGMPDALLETASQPFVALENRDHLAAADESHTSGSAAAEHTGAGLGLPLVRLLAELHGGRLELRNGENGGVAATIVFPAERLIGPAMPETASDTEALRA